jgi:hypothetical protein
MYERIRVLRAIQERGIGFETGEGSVPKTGTEVPPG